MLLQHVHDVCLFRLPDTTWHGPGMPTLFDKLHQAVSTYPPGKLSVIFGKMLVVIN